MTWLPPLSTLWMKVRLIFVRHTLTECYCFQHKIPRKIGKQVEKQVHLQWLHYGHLGRRGDMLYPKSWNGIWDKWVSIQSLNLYLGSYKISGIQCSGEGKFNTLPKSNSEGGALWILHVYQNYLGKLSEPERAWNCININLWAWKTDSCLI